MQRDSGGARNAIAGERVDARSNGSGDAAFATWNQAEARLGRYVRGQLLLVAFAATVLSGAFRAIGLPYWLMLGVFSGVVELIPVVGPLAAGVVSVGVALTVSLHAAVLTAVAVYGLRLLQDYVLVPRVIGRAVALPPLATLVVVAVVGVALGPAMVPIATPLAAVLFVPAEHRLARDV